MDEIMKFIKKNPQNFKSCGPNSGSWHYMINDGREIGTIWFKNLLGGWNMYLNGGAMVPVESINVLKHLVGYKKPSFIKRLLSWL